MSATEAEEVAGEVDAGVAEPRPAAWFAPAGALIGFAGAICGIGGGLFAGPLLHVARGIPLKRAAATALLVVLATTVAATGTELLRAEPVLDWSVVLPLAAGALAGAQLGFAIAQRLDERRLKLVFAVVLGLAGLKLLVSAEPVAGGLEPGELGRASVALVIGVLGGTLTPILGVAGGLLMVPALFLTLGGLGFGGARAAALAAGAVAAVRSLFLHARQGNVAFALGAPLAAGALVGAAAGALAAHLDGLATVGRVLLGALLVLQALRFALELRRPR